MALPAPAKSTLPISQLPENEENSEVTAELTSPIMKTLLNSMYPTLNNSKEKESRTSAKMSTRSPLRCSAKRRGLATLQPSAAGKGSVVGALRGDSVFAEFPKQKKDSSVFTSPVWTDPTCRPTQLKSSRPSSPIATNEISTQTESEEWLTIGQTREKDSLAEEALALLRSEPSEQQYLKQIAEERRLALEETLKENEELYDEVDLLKEKCEKLDNALNEAENYKILYMAMLENDQRCQCGRTMQEKVNNAS